MHLQDSVKNQTGHLLKRLDYQNVEIKDSYIEHSFALETEYLLSLDADRLLAGFRETAGLKPKKIRYGGWEQTEIQGHTLGHYLTALSQGWAASRDVRYLDRVAYVLQELVNCQSPSGYLFASKEELFDRVEKKQPVWVPWYTMDKILQGLIAAYTYTGSNMAYDILQKLCDWIANRVLAWNAETQKTVLAVEYGGMNGVLYEAYHISENEKYAKAAHMFDEMELFESLYKKIDVLNGLHANATIPKVIGALKRYVYYDQKDDFYLTVAKNFWELVIENHTYITGGNSEWEHFGEPKILDAERTACNCETCNTYNMLKLSGILFAVTKEKKYADYDEQTFINAILSSQNSKNGMTTYFQPMSTGYFKVFSGPYDKFWCCTGSGMENFTKQSENFAFLEDKRIYLNRLLSARYHWKEQQLEIEVKTDWMRSSLFELQVLSRTKGALEIAVRIPQWAKSSRVVDAAEAQVSIENGYYILQKKWQGNECIRFFYEETVEAHSLPDNKYAVAFTYGPFVLSADLGTDDLETAVTGVDVSVATRRMMISDCLLMEKKSKNWMQEVCEMFSKTENQQAFLFIDGEGKKLLFAPHYLKDEVRYGIYFVIFEKGSADSAAYLLEQERKHELLATQYDVIPLGNDQYELAHQVKGERTDSVTCHGKKGRLLLTDGWISFEMKAPKQAAELVVCFTSVDKGAEVEIQIDGEFLGIHEVQGAKEVFYEETYRLPVEKEKNTINVRFLNKQKTKSVRILGELFIRNLNGN